MASGNVGHVKQLMKSFLDHVPEEMRSQILIDRHIQRVHNQFKEVVDPFILLHTNSVYLLKDKQDNGEYELIVYVDNSTIAAELNARRELIRLKYRERFSIKVSKFEIYISKGEYRKKYPFKEEKIDNFRSKSYKHELSDKDKQAIDSIINDLPEGRMKDSFKRAISAEKKHGLL